MNQKIPFQTLASRLADVAGISDEESVKFIRDFFDTVIDGLLSDGQVSVKGFGNFELVRGDEPKVMFQPDAAVSGIVNAPFLQFEPEVLNPAVTDEMLAEIKSVEDNIKDQEPDAADDDDEEPVYIPLPTADKDDTTEQSSDPNPIVDESAESVTTSAEILPITEVEEETITETDLLGTEEVEYEPEESSKGGFGMGFLIGIIVGLAVGAAATFFYTNLIADRFSTPSDEDNQEMVDDESANDDAPDILSAATTDSLMSVTDTIVAAQSAEPVIAPVATEPLKDHIRAGYLMTQMAAKHYGNSAFWVYIYEENKSKIKNPNNVPAGLELIIPPVEKYGIDASNPASVSKAKALEATIFSHK